LEDGRSLVQDAEGVFVGEEQVGSDPTSEVQVAVPRHRLVFSDRADGGPASVVVACERSCEEIFSRGTPDRVALSPDGTVVAMVAAVHGLPAVWVMGFDGRDPRQLTNVGLHEYLPGEPPGFVPPPDLGPLAFDGDDVVWTAAGEPYRVAWR